MSHTLKVSVSVGLNEAETEVRIPKCQKLAALNRRNATVDLTCAERVKLVI